MYISSLFRRRNKILMKAIDENDIEKVRKLIEQGANLNIQYEEWDNETPLIRSLKKGHDEIANLLLDNGAMVDVPLIRNYWGDVEKGTCALFEAVIRNKYDIVKKMISQGAKLNVELDNKTALGIALGGEYTEIAKLLIDNGADYSDVGIWDEHKYIPILDYYVLERPSDPDILLIFEAIKRKEEEKKGIMQEIRDTSIMKLHNKFNKDGVNRFSNKAIEAYVDVKTKGYISNIKELDNKDIDDLLELYNYKEPVENKDPADEITQEEIRQLNKSKPIYIRGFRYTSYNSKPKHNETAAIAEIRKLLRQKGKPTLTKIKGVKTGRYAQCFSMANYGSVRPFVDVGVGAILTKKKKVRLAASTCMCSAYKKNMDAIAVSERKGCGSKRDRENMPVYKKIDNMLKNKKWQIKASRYDEVIMDVSDEDIKFIFFSNNSNYYKLHAIYLQRKYKELSGRTLPIFKYRVNRKDCFIKKDFTNEEIVAMLKDVLIDNFNSANWNYDLFVTFNDELNQIPGYRDFVNKFLLRNDAFDLYSRGIYSTNNFIESYGMINKAKYIGLVLGKDKQKEYIKMSFDNIKVYNTLEFMAELKQLEIDEEMKAFLEPKINSIKCELIKKSGCIESNSEDKNIYFKYKNVYKEKEDDIYTSLICAIEEKDKQRVLQILGDIQDVNVIDKKTGSLALTEAIRVGDFELVKLLVNEYNADVNKKDGIGYTPISLARGRKDIKKFLIDRGAECNLYEKGDIYSLNPGEFLGGLLRRCWYTACSLWFACSSILMFVNYVCHGIIHGIMYGMGYAIRKFHNYMKILRAPVAYFCTKGLAGEKIVKLLLKVGFSPNKTLYGKRPLMIILDRCAHMKWSAETDAEFKEIQDCLSRNIELLVKYGADVSYRDNSGYSPLEKAIQCGFFATAKFLVQKGADVNGKSNGTSFIMTPRNWPSLLMMASRKRNYDMVIFLIRHGANFEYSYIPNLFRDDRPSALGGVEAGILCAIYNEDKDKLNEMFNYYKCRPDYLKNRWIGDGRPEPPESFMYVLKIYVLPKVQDKQIRDQLKNFMDEKETKTREVSRGPDKQSTLLDIHKEEEPRKAGPSIVR